MVLSSSLEGETVEELDGLRDGDCVEVEGDAVGDARSGEKLTKKSQDG